MNTSRKIGKRRDRLPGHGNGKTIEEILGEVFTDEIEAACWRRLLASPDDRVVAKASELALKYKFGLPAVEIKHGREIVSSEQEG